MLWNCSCQQPILNLQILIFFLSWSQIIRENNCFLPKPISSPLKKKLIFTETFRICRFRIGCWYLMNKILGIGFRQQLPDIEVIVSDRDITYLFWRIKNKSKLSDVLFRYYTDLSSFSNFFLILIGGVPNWSTPQNKQVSTLTFPAIFVHLLKVS